MHFMNIANYFKTSNSKLRDYIEQLNEKKVVTGTKIKIFGEQWHKGC